jgi:hypothetical protein
MMFATKAYKNLRSLGNNTITTSTYSIQIYPLLNSRSFGYIFSLLESKISLFFNKRFAFAGEKQPWKAHLKFSRLHQRGTLLCFVTGMLPSGREVSGMHILNTSLTVLTIILCATLSK